MSSRRLRIGLALLSGCVALGCAAPVASPASVPVPGSAAADAKELLRLDAEFSAVSVEKGAAAAFASYLAADAVELPAGQEPNVGRERIVADLADTSHGTFVLRWAPEHAEASGELGYTWGRYVLVVTPREGAASTQYGKYVTVWRRQKDGTWKGILDMGNASPAPGAKAQ